MFCKKETGTYAHWCTRVSGHKGRCSHGFISTVVKRVAKKPGSKLQMDTYQTPGDKKAVKNRAPRCYPDKRTKTEVQEANQRGEYGVCIRRRFSSTPEDCFHIHVELATQIVSLCEAENKLEEVANILKSTEEADVLDYLRTRAEVKYPSTGAPCRICREPMKLENFDTQHGTSGDYSAQLGHIHPYIQGHEETAHVKGNVQWIHRNCNMIQGEKTEEETLQELSRILRAHGHIS